MNCEDRPSYGRCKDCKRCAHSMCLDRLLLKQKFYCHDICRFLDKGSVERTLPEVVGERTVPESCRCLVCGDEVISEGIECSKSSCGYQAHEACAAVIFSSNGKRLNAAKFCCNSISHYLKPSEVSNVVEW